MQYNRLNNPNALIDAIKALDKRVSNVETKGTGPIGFVGSDGVELHIGVQPDGEALIVPFVGDTTPPPVATSPIASAGVGSISVAWDGLFVNGAAQPADFQHLKVLGHKVVNGDITLTVEVGMLRKSLDEVYVNSDVAAVGETWKFSFVSVDYNGNASAQSTFSATVSQTSFKTDVLISEAISSLSNSVTGAQASADGKSTNYYEATAPSNVPAGTLSKGDTWFDTANGYRVSTWTGSAWQTTQDAALAQLTADSKGRTYTQNVAPPVEARNDKNLWIDTSAGVGLYVTKYWDGSAWTALKDADAKAAQDTADAKGETIYSNTEPAAAKRLSQNLWVDTTGGLNINKRWDGFAWVVVVDSRIPSTAAAVTAVDSRVDSVSAVAESKGITYTQSTTPPVSARLPQNLWNDTSLGLNFTVTKFWDPTANAGAGAWVAVSGKDASDAQAAAAADASAKAAAAINAQAYSLNPSFDDWSAIAPTGYGQWSGSTPVKETVIFKRGPNAMRFNVPDATAQQGVSWSSIMGHAPNLEFFTVEVDLYLASGTLDGSGMILDWAGMTNNRAQIQFSTELPGAVTGKWYRVSKVLRRPTNATGTWTAMTGYLMGQWSGHGTGAAKNIIFDWFNVRPSTTEEILSYKAPTTQYVDTAEADAIAAAALLDNKVNSSRTYINRGTSANGITLINGIAPVVVDSPTAMSGKALQKSGTGNGWWVDSNAKQAFDPSALYKLQARVRVVTPATTGGKGFYLGVQGYLADGVTHCNATGANSTGSQHYLISNSQTPSGGGWVDYVGYFKGNSTGNATGAGTTLDPYKLHVNVRHIEPLVILDFSAGNGVWEVSHLSLEVVAPEAAIDAAAADTNNKLLTKTRNYFQTAKPTGGTYLHGDVWIDTDDGNKVYVYDTTGGFNDFRVAQDTAIDKALYSTFPTDIDTSATNKWLFTKYNKGTSAGHVPQYSDIVGFAGTSSLVSDAATLVSAQGDQYIGQLRTIVNVLSSTTATVTASHDDGARVYVDGVSVYSHSAARTNNSISMTLSAGWHVIDFMWAEQSGGDGWTAVSPLLSTQVTSMFAPVSLSAVAATANTAVTSANGKNKVIYSASDATGTTGYSAGDTWFKRDPGTGVVSAQWEFTTAWQPRTLSESVLGNISAGKIVADWLEAGVIKAGAIDAAKLNVSMGGNNLVPNSSFEVDSDSNGLADSWQVWARGAGDAGRVFTNTRVAGLFPGSTWAQRVETTTATNTEQSSIQSTALFSISAGSKAVLSLYGRANSTQVFSISMRCENDAAAYMGDANFNATFTTTAQRFSGLVIIPAGTTKAKVTITTPTAPANGSWFEVDGVKAELGDILSAWSPLTSELLPGTISGNLLTATAIDGKTITGATVQTETTASRGIKLTGTEFAGFDGTGVKNFSLTSAGALTLKGAIQSGSSITGATVTGSTVQTESTTDRGIKLTSTELAGFDGAGIKNFSLTTAGTLTLRGAIQSGSTIEGARITGTQGLETSLSALTGVKINNAGIKAYDAGNNLTFSVDATTGLIEAPGLKANTITSTMISATAIDGKTITGAVIQTEATTDRGIKLTSTELSGYDGAGIKNLSLTSTGALTLRGEIKSGSTIEGARITGTQGLETSTVANTGVKINNVGIKAYDAGNNLTFHLDATTGLLEVPGIKANAITGDKIATDAITAKHLSIGDFTNLAYGGEFNSADDVANWTLETGISYTTSAPQSGAGCLVSAANASPRSAYLNTSVSVQPLDQFQITFWYKTSSDFNGTSTNSKFRIGDQTGAHLQSTTFQTVSTSWTKVTASYTVPASGVTALKLSIVFDHTVGSAWIDDVVVRKRFGTTLIENGAITTDHMTSGTIDAGVLVAGSVKALQVGAKAITADKLVITSTDNLVQEGTFNAAGISWELPSGFAINNTAGRNSTPAMVITNTAALQTSYNAVGNPTKVPIEVQSNGGSAYRVIGWVNSSASVPASGAYITTRFLSSSGSTSVSSVYASGTLAANTWTEMSGVVVAPPNTISISFSINSSAEISTGTLKWDMVSVTRAATGSLIVDGAIDGKTITGAEIKTNPDAETGVYAQMGQYMVSDFGTEDRPGFGFINPNSSSPKIGMFSEDGQNLILMGSRAIINGPAESYIILHKYNSDLYNYQVVNIIAKETNVNSMVNIVAGGEINIDAPSVKVNGNPIQESWQSMTLAGSWVNYTGGGGYIGGLRARRIGTNVQIQGMVKNGSGTISTLPTDLWPQFSAIRPVIAAGAAASIGISNAGVISYLTGTAAPSYVSINEILPL